MIRAVIFDLGGVVLESPLALIDELERQQGLESGLVARVVGGYAGRPEGPWQRLERGEIALDEFCRDFDREVAAHGVSFSSASMMAEMGARAEPRPAFVEAIRRLRGAGRLVAALTNNWQGSDLVEARMERLRAEFDVFVESWRVGMRKPDPKIYLHTLDLLEVPAEGAAFVDDIGSNLKAARALGLVTIKVTDPRAALIELEAVTGVALAG